MQQTERPVSLGVPGFLPLGALRISARELEVLELIADGGGNRDVAKVLGLSEETVKTHVRRVLAKLGASTRAHAVAIALRAGLIR